MNVRDIQSLIESWAPREIAWERDNIGLQCGDPNAEVHRILVALDVTEGVIAEAHRRKADLLISHHPLLFRPVQSIHPGNPTGRCLRALIARNISLLSAHTNLDFTLGGTSFALAKALGLEKVEFLHRPYRMQKKIVTFVPASHVDAVAGAMAKAGAGTIGNYEGCSFRTVGTGTFQGNASSSPAVGRQGVLEEVPEVRLEMVVQQWDVDRVVRAMRSAHPYEEVAYDLFASEIPATDFGMGIIGTLPRAVPPAAFVRTIKKVLGVTAVRSTPFHTDRVQRIAACGGSGSDLLGEAIRQHADLFVTADVKYHAFHEALGETILVDAGHWETEFPVVRALASRLDKEIRRRTSRVPITVASTPTNPVRYV
jgi:dinuclear metal center YbgI/SA1388 family protein